MVRGFYYCCDFLHTAAAAWLMLMVAGAAWKPKVGGRVRKIIWAVTVVLVAGFNTVNNSMISVLFSRIALLINIMLVSLVSALIYRCRC